MCYQWYLRQKHALITLEWVVQFPRFLLKLFFRSDFFRGAHFSNNNFLFKKWSFQAEEKNPFEENVEKGQSHFLT